MNFSVEGYDAYFKDENSMLFLADSLQLLKNFPAESVDVIFADPPYFLSNGGFTNGGFTNSGGKIVSVNLLKKNTNLIANG